MRGSKKKWLVGATLVGASVVLTGAMLWTWASSSPRGADWMKVLGDEIRNGSLLYCTLIAVSGEIGTDYSPGFDHGLFASIQAGDSIYPSVVALGEPLEKYPGGPVEFVWHYENPKAQFTVTQDGEIIRRQMEGGLVSELTIERLKNREDLFTFPGDHTYVDAPITSGSPDPAVELWVYSGPAAGHDDYFFKALMVNTERAKVLESITELHLD